MLLVLDPDRWHLLRELAGSDLRVGELVERLAKPQNLVSYHLAELRRAGLGSGRRSAGSHPKALHPNAVRAMAERGIHISGRPTKHLSRFARTRYDRVITLCDKVREICPEFPGRPATAHWSMADPAAEADTDEGSY